MTFTVHHEHDITLYCFHPVVTHNDACHIMTKMEIAVDYEHCAGSHVFTTVNGEMRPPFMTKNPPVLKVNRVNTSWEETEICIGLQAPCNDLRTLCYGKHVCWYVLFGNNDCCVENSFHV